MSDFLWGGIAKEFKYHLVDWEVAPYRLDKRHLGIRSLVLFNKALMGKCLQKRVTDKKYGHDWGIGYQLIVPLSRNQTNLK